MAGRSRGVWRKWIGGLVFGVSLAVGMGPVARAAEIETRDFTVLVDGKPAGDVHMTIHRLDTGVIEMRCDTDIKVSGLIRKYVYNYRGREMWKDNRLLRLDSTCNDEGKRFMVSAVAEPQGLRLRVNNQERLVRPDVWLTSYWCLPDARLRNETLAVLDADNGRLVDGRLNFVGAEQRGIAGQALTVNHFRLIGKTNVDLWYDGAERLVRQEWLEEGHRAVLELVRVRR